MWNVFSGINENQETIEHVW